MKRHLLTSILVLTLVGCGLDDSNDSLLLAPPSRDDGGMSFDAGSNGDQGDKEYLDMGISVDSGGETENPDAANVDDATNGNEPRDTGMGGEPEDMAPPPEDSGPSAVCGNGNLESGEQCDDDNRRGGDGCNSNCVVETGYVCNSASPSSCGPAPSPGSGDGKCEPNYGSDVYDPYPGGHGNYPKGDSGSYGWRGEDFESYSNGELVEASSNKGRRAHLEVTSGVLEARYVNGSQVYRRGWTTTYNFRVLSRARSGGDKVRFTNVSNRARVYIKTWQQNVSATSGAHLFARYQTENDLYVASLRYDNQVVIKRKHCDVYKTLAAASFSQGAVQTGKWYALRFDVEGQRLRFYIDGKLEVEAFDSELSWGTTGIRTDRSDVYFDDWSHN